LQIGARRARLRAGPVRPRRGARRREGVQKNETEAVEWLRKALSRGSRARATTSAT